MFFFLLRPILSLFQENVLNTSTPMKNKRHKFLKRGEGLKRFQKGNNAFIPTKEKEKQKKNSNKKTSNNTQNQTTKKKGVVLTIEPPPQTKPALVRKTRPGLPLKLNLKHRVQKETTSVPNIDHNFGISHQTQEKTIEEVEKLDPKFISAPM